MLWTRRKRSSQPLDAVKLVMPSPRAIDLASLCIMGPVIRRTPNSFWLLYHCQTSRFVSSFPVSRERLFRLLMCGFESAAFSSHSRWYFSLWDKMLRICVLPHPKWAANWRNDLPVSRWTAITSMRSAKLNSWRLYLFPGFVGASTVKQDDDDDDNDDVDWDKFGYDASGVGGGRGRGENHLLQFVVSVINEASSSLWLGSDSILAYA